MCSLHCRLIQQYRKRCIVHFVERVHLRTTGRHAGNVHDQPDVQHVRRWNLQFDPQRGGLPSVDDLRRGAARDGCGQRIQQPYLRKLRRRLVQYDAERGDLYRVVDM